MYQRVQRFDENDVDTLSTIGTFLSIIGLLSGNSRIELLTKILQMPIHHTEAMAYAVCTHGWSTVLCVVLICV